MLSSCPIQSISIYSALSFWENHSKALTRPACVNRIAGQLIDIMKMIVVLISLVSLALAEPPVGDGYEHAHRQYLPPDFSEAARTKSTFNEASNEISQEYGPPGFRDSLSQQYGTPIARNPSSYGAPNTRNIPKEYTAFTDFSEEYSRSGVSQVYGEPTSRSSPSEIYGAPQRSSSYNIPEVRLTSRHPSPVQKYGVPRFSNQSPVQHGDLSRSYQSPMDAFKSSRNQFSTRSNVPQTYGAPSRSLSAEYVAPGITATDSYSHGLSRSVSNVYGAPSVRTPLGEYGTPEARTVEKSNAVDSSYPGRSSVGDYDAATRSEVSSGYSYSRSALEELLNQEPANYEFGYKVSDYTSGSDFGHVESRQAARAEGSYFVVLPDGTKQVVEYEADERGFKPRISVESAESGPY